MRINLQLNSYNSIVVSRTRTLCQFPTHVYEKGRPLRLLITPGQESDTAGAAYVLQNLGSKSAVLADNGYDADWIRLQIKAHGATANIPNKLAVCLRHQRQSACCARMHPIENRPTRSARSADAKEI